MSFNKYYQDELAYLRELGAEFASENPNLAPYLSKESNDPDVERLMEGFAFLTGRLRQKLDDELPELTHSLTQLMWPQFLRPIPAMTVVQFQPLPEAGAERRVVPAGVGVASRPIEGVVCQFQTCNDLPVVPAEIEDVRVENTARAGYIEVQVRLSPDVTFADLSLDRLRLYLRSTRGSGGSRALYLALLRHCRNVVAKDAQGREFTVPGSSIRPLGLDADESVIPMPEGTSPAYLLLLEYFAFPQKFMFVELSGLGPSAAFSGSTLTLTFELDEPFALATAITRDSMVLNCAVVANLFDADADPISLDQRKTEYRLTARSGNQRHDIHSVRSVSGWIQRRGSRIEYPPFEAFRSLAGGNQPIYYAIRRKPAIVGSGVDTYVAFVRDDGTDIAPDVETVSLAVRCTNGRLAEHIPVGQVDQPTGTTPSFVQFRNIQPVSGQVPPPINVGLLWGLVSSMALNFGSLLTVQALRSLMSTYFFRAHFDAQERRRLDLMMVGTKEVGSKAMDWILKGRPVRGTEIHVTVEESKFGGDGEVFLWGSVLARFLDLYANVNAVHRLRIRGAERNVTFAWPIRTGTRPSL